MSFNLLDRLGDWNPQLFRELKGRLKWRTAIVIVFLSLIGQFLAFGYSFLQLSNNIPVPSASYSENYPEYRPYCTGAPSTEQYARETMLRCVRISNTSFEINGQKWWQMVHHNTSLWLIGGITLLLIVGTVFMLLSDLAREERRGNLNFLRLSPQSAMSMFLGKLLGVPILLYLAILFALPFHIWNTLASDIPLSHVLGFDAVLGGSWLLFSSLALLLALLNQNLSGFQAWLGGGAVLMFLAMTFSFATSNTPVDNPTMWFRLMSPAELGALLLVNKTSLPDTQWFFLPIGQSNWSLVSFSLVNDGLWTWGIWQVLRRRFHNPTKTFLSKHQSYWLVFGFNVMLLGFALQMSAVMEKDSYSSYSLASNFGITALFSGLLMLVLIALMTPDRQTLQDWTRYRHMERAGANRRQQLGLLQDLIWGEKSPALVAIATNLAISSLICLPWLLPQLQYPGSLIRTLLAIAFAATIVLICATIAQLMLLMKTPKRTIWAFGAIIIVTILPLTVMGVLGLNPSTDPIWFLLSALPWMAIPHASLLVVTQAWLLQGFTALLLTLRLTSLLKRMGASGSKALLDRATLPTLEGT